MIHQRPGLELIKPAVRAQSGYTLTSPHEHSTLRRRPTPEEHVLATGDYGGSFPNLVGQGSLIGAQFHPEKSQQAGLALLAAFAEWRP